MTHKIRGVRVDEYAYDVNKLRQNVGLETWITSNCDITNSAHQIQLSTMNNWLNPPMKSSVDVTSTCRLVLICMTSVVAKLPEGPLILNSLGTRKWKFASDLRSFGKEIYCIEASSCEIVGTSLRPQQTFGAPRSDSVKILRPGNCDTLAPVVTPL